MEMNKTRTLIREQRLEKFSRILSNRYNIELKLSPAKHKVGCCDTTRKIWISSTIDQDPIHNLLLQKATALHELGHMLFTDNKAWVKYCVSSKFANVLSDGRVEEGMSRLFPKARLYFIYLNRKLNPVVIHKKVDLSIDMNKMIYELVFREAKRNVGIPQLPIDIKIQLKKFLGNDYDWILQKTREVVNAKTENNAAKIAYDLEMKLQEITKERCEIGKIDKSLETCGAGSRQLPKMTEDEIVDKLEELYKLEEQQIDNEIKAEEEKKKLEESLKQDEPEIQENVEKEHYEPDEIEDVSLEDSMINDHFGGDTNSEPEKEDTTENENIDNDLPEQDSDIEISDDETNIKIPKEETPGELPDLDEISKQIEDTLNSIADQAEDRITSDAEDELRNENDTIQAGEADADFESYDTVDTDDLKPRGSYGVYLKPVDTSKLDPVARKISRNFKIIAQYGDGWIHNQTRGRLEMHRIHSVIDKNKRARIFRKKDEIASVDLAVCILLDASGSMSDRKFVATDTAYTISRALELGNYKSEVVQFGVKAYSTKVFGVKSFNQKTQYARKRFKPVAEGQTPMLEALEGAERSLSNQDAKRKVCFVVTDGYPFAYNANKVEYQDKCRKQILKMEKQGITVVGILIKTTDRRKIFHDDRKIICHSVKDVEKNILDVLKKVLIKLKNT